MTDENLIRHPKGERLALRLLLLHKQFSDVDGLVMHMIRDTIELSRYQTRKAVDEFLKSSLSDVLTQVTLLIDELGYNEEELRKAGWDRWQERMFEFEKEHAGRKWL